SATRPQLRASHGPDGGIEEAVGMAEIDSGVTRSQGDEHLDLTVLIPVLNEAENMAPLLAKLAADLAPLGLRYEVLVIDDGSTDGTAKALHALKPSTPALRMISFRRNYGKSAALSVGFREARGARIVTMDGDLQDDSAE